MCGIVGMVSAKRAMSQDQCELFEQLFVVDALRGMDGAGVLKVRHNGLFSTAKVYGTPIDLFRDKSYGALHYPKDGKKRNEIFSLIGHNRWATSGKKSNKNAHPFTCGKITMVHNGTLLATEDLPRFKEFEVDSEALCNAIDELGIQEVVNRVWGAYTIVYYDSAAKTLNVLRNGQRPLHYYALSEHLGEYAFASEKAMLWWILHRNNKIWATQQGPTVQEVPTHTLFTFSVETGLLVQEKMEPKRVYQAYSSPSPRPHYSSSWKDGDVGSEAWWAGRDGGRRSVDQINEDNGDIVSWTRYNLRSERAEFWETDSSRNINRLVGSRVMTADELVHALAQEEDKKKREAEEKAKKEAEAIPESRTVQIQGTLPMPSTVVRQRPKLLVVSATGEVSEQKPGDEHKTILEVSEAEPSIRLGKDGKWIRAASFSGYKRGQPFLFSVDNVVEVTKKESPTRVFRGVGQRKEYSSVEVVFHTQDEHLANAINFSGIAQGKIFDILTPVRGKRMVIYVKEIEPVLKETTIHDSVGKKTYSDMIDLITNMQEDANKGADNTDGGGGVILH